MDITERAKRIIEYVAEIDEGGIADDDIAIPEVVKHLQEAMLERVIELERERDEAWAEVSRLHAGGCARDQRTTQHCAEATALQREVDRLRDALLRILDADVALDAILQPASQGSPFRWSLVRCGCTSFTLSMMETLLATSSRASLKAGYWVARSRLSRR